MVKKINKIPKFKTQKDEIIWNNVMEITKSKGMKKADLARRIKVDPQYFTKIESAITGIGAETLKKIMEPRILEGDLVVVDPMASIANGDVCLLEINGEIKCRYVFFSESVTRLVALNPKYPELILKGEADFRIIGRVVDFIGRFPELM